MIHSLALAHAATPVEESKEYGRDGMSAAS